MRYGFSFEPFAELLVADRVVNVIVGVNDVCQSEVFVFENVCQFVGVEVRVDHGGFLCLFISNYVGKIAVVPFKLFKEHKFNQELFLVQSLKNLF